MVLLITYGLGLAAVLLGPVSFSSITESVSDLARDGLGLGWVRNGLVEAGANIVIFIPVGLLLAVATGRMWFGTVTGLIVSASAELAQLVIPTRVTSIRDILANALGTVIGVGVAWLITGRPESH